MFTTAAYYTAEPIYCEGLYGEQQQDPYGYAEQRGASWSSSGAAWSSVTVHTGTAPKDRSSRSAKRTTPRVRKMLAGLETASARTPAVATRAAAAADPEEMVSFEDRRMDALRVELAAQPTAELRRRGQVCLGVPGSAYLVRFERCGRSPPHILPNMVTHLWSSSTVLPSAWSPCPLEPALPHQSKSDFALLSLRDFR